MREILFRGFGTDIKVWIYGFYCHTESGKEVIPDIQTLNANGNLGACYKVESSTVGQCTGLQDKNGKRIFEGDIVQWCRQDITLSGHYAYGFADYKYGARLVVRCLDSGFTLCDITDKWTDTPNSNNKVDNYALWSHQCSLEVIGNIHDNPELLPTQRYRYAR